MTGKLLAWHGDPDLKAEAVERMRDHQEADTFMRGLYAEVDPDAARRYRGCFHGCLTTEALAAEAGMSVVDYLDKIAFDGDPDWHAETQRLFGIPEPLGRLLDSTFEYVPAGTAGPWAVQATEAIPVGADLSLVTARVVLDVLTDDEYGVLRFTAEGSAQRMAVGTAAGLYRRLAGGGGVETTEWWAARELTYELTYKAREDDVMATWTARRAVDHGVDDCGATSVVNTAVNVWDGFDFAAYWLWVADRIVHHLANA